MSRIVAVANQKGGQGKTTSTLALGTALAERGYRVLIVDLDPQASLTSAAGIEPEALDITIYTAFTQYMAEATVPAYADLARPLGPSLALLPSSLDLALAEMDLHNAVRREYVLAEILAVARDDYDIVLVDCPPSLTWLTINALTAAQQVLIPVVPEFLAARGLGQLLGTIGRVKRNKLNPSLEIVGAVLTMVDMRTAHGRHVAERIRAFLDGQAPVLGEVKRSIRASEAAEAGESLLHYDTRGEAARGYRDVADALLAAWGEEGVPASVEEATVTHG